MTTGNRDDGNFDSLPYVWWSIGSYRLLVAVICHQHCTHNNIIYYNIKYMFRQKRRPLLRGDSLTLLPTIKVYKFLFFSFTQYLLLHRSFACLISYKRYYYSVSRVITVFILTSFNIITS